MKCKYYSVCGSPDNCTGCKGFTKTDEIARKYFCSLVIDEEYPDVIFCRVLIDGYYHSNLTAKNRKEAIEIFNNTEWRF